MIRGGTSRLMVPTTVAVTKTAATPSSSSSPSCQVPSLQEPSVSSPELTVTSHGSTASKAAANVRLSNAGRLIFSPAPSAEEVEEATEQLHATLQRSIPVDKSLAGEGSITASAGSSAVHQAFQLLQTNSNVKDAVKSVACDPFVWRALMSNEKVQALLSSQIAHKGPSETVYFEPSFGRQGVTQGEETIASKVWDFVMDRVLQILDKVVEMVSSIFSSAVKDFLSKESSTKSDMTLASSCLMLAVTVLLVVFVKRA